MVHRADLTVAIISYILQLTEGNSLPLLSYNLLSELDTAPLYSIIFLHNTFFMVQLMAILGALLFLWGTFALNSLYILNLLRDILDNYAERQNGRRLLEEILKHYKKLTILSRLLNSVLAYPILIMIGVGCFQMILDFYVVFQFIKMKESDEKWLEIGFYVQDASIVSILLYNSFRILASANMAALELTDSIKLQLTKLDPSDRKYIRRVVAALHIMTFRIGPINIDQETIANGILELSQHYICAILW